MLHTGQRAQEHPAHNYVGEIVVLFQVRNDNTAGGVISIHECEGPESREGAAYVDLGVVPSLDNVDSLLQPYERYLWESYEEHLK